MTMAACFANYNMSLPHGMSSTVLLRSQQHDINCHNGHHQQQQQYSYHLQQPPQLQHHQLHSHTHAHLTHSQSSSATTSSSALSRSSSQAAATGVTKVNRASITAPAVAANKSINSSNSSKPKPNESSGATMGSNVSSSVESRNSLGSETVSLDGAENVTSLQKDYSIPLHVDCSVEYELPNQPKPPMGQRVEPLLMIHPCYFRKIESQRRSPFVNNMPLTARNNTTLLVNSMGSTTSSSVTTLSGVGADAVAGASSVPNVSSSMSASTTRRASVRQPQGMQQHQVVAQYRQRVQHQQLRKTSPQQEQQFQQQQMSQMSQQAHFPVVITHHHHLRQQQQNHTNIATTPTSTPNATISTSAFMDHAGAVRRGAVVAGAAQHLSNHSRTTATVVDSAFLGQKQQHQCSSESNKFNVSATLVVAPAPATSQSHPNLRAQNTAQWNHLATIDAGSCITPVASATTVHSRQMLGTRNVPTQAIFGKSLSSVGKRDAMISGGVYRGAAAAKVSIHHNSTNQQQEAQHRLPANGLWADPTSMPTASAATSTITSALMVDRSPMASVPSNYQAGPDTTPTIDTHNHCLRDDKYGGKYRQYLRTHRMHPYYSAATSVSAVPNFGQTFPQFLGTPSFQHIHQISCYNV